MLTPAQFHNVDNFILSGSLSIQQIIQYVYIKTKIIDETNPNLIDQIDKDIMINGDINLDLYK